MLKKTLVVIFTLLLLGAYTVASANTIYVDDDNIIGPWEGTTEKPFQKIQDAVNAANPGDTVYVYNGYYLEDIFVNSTLYLIGEDIESTIIEGDRLIFELNADGISISNFTIGQSRVSWGVKVNSNSNQISKNKITYASYGVYLNENSEGNTITNNNISSCNYAVGIMGSSSNNIFNNTITNRYIGYSSGTGIKFYSGSNNNEIYDNDILYKQFGIELYTAQNNEIHGNNILNGYYGIHLERTYSYNTDTSNSYSDNLIDNNTIGIKIEGEQTDDIIGNTISNNEKGIELREEPKGNITDNSIENNDYGIYLTISEDENLYDDLLSSNTFSGNNEDIEFYNYSYNFSEFYKNYTSSRTKGNEYFTAFVMLSLIIIIGVIFLLIFLTKKRKDEGFIGKKKPVGVIIIAILSLIAAIILIIQQFLSTISLYYMFGGGNLYTVIISVISVLIIMLFISLAYGFLKGMRWSWFLAIIWFVISMGILSVYTFWISSIGWFSEDFEIFFLTFNIIFIVFIILFGLGLLYLTRPHVMNYFEVAFSGFFSPTRNLTRVVITIFVVFMVLSVGSLAWRYQPYIGPIEITNFDYLPEDAQLGDKVTFYAKIKDLPDNHSVILVHNNYCNGNKRGSGSQPMEKIESNEYKVIAWIPEKVSSLVGETCTYKLVKYQIYIYNNEELDDFSNIGFGYGTPLVKSQEICFSN